MNTKKLSSEPDGTIAKVVGIDANGNVVKQSVSSFSGNILLSKKTGLNFNTTSDQSITLSGGSNFIITNIVFTNASVNMDTAACNDGFLFSAANRAGNKIAYMYNIIQSFSSLTVSNKVMQSVSASTHSAGEFQCGNTIYFSLTTPQGVPATADMYIFGMMLP